MKKYCIDKSIGGIAGLTKSKPGKIYYVKNGGNDSADGLSIGNAWATISKVNGFTFPSGDVTLSFAKGDIWRETLTIPRSGISGTNFKISSYITGSAQKPQILGSEKATTWTNTSGNIWRTNITFTNPRVSGNKCDLLFMKSAVINYGLNKVNTGALAAEFDWTWSSNYIYVYSTTDPASAYTWVEIPQRTFGIDLNGKEYLSFTGICYMYQVFNSIYAAPAAKTDALIDLCSFSYIGGSVTNDTDCTGYAISCNYSNLTVQNSEFNNCGRRAVSLDIYGNGYTATGCVIQDNYFHDGYHTTGVDIKSGGGYTGAWNGITIRRNLFVDPSTSPYGTEHIWIEQGSGGSLQNISIYSNIFKYASSGHAFIHTQGVDATHGPTGLNIFHNVFYEHGTPTTATCAMIWLHRAFTVKIKNNIFYSTKADDNNYSAIMIYCYGGAQDPAEVDANYNLYYTTNASARIIVANGNSYNKSQFASWKSALGWDTNSPVPADPKFVSSSDYHLQPSSPARGAGLSGLGVALGNDKIAFATPPSIGAYEYV